MSKIDAGPACGDPGFACCAGNGCKAGGCCVDSICMAEGGTCATLGGGTCAAGACGTCGGPGLACCTSGTGSGSCTAPDTLCSGGTCERCGSVGYNCCAAGAGGAGVCNDANSLCGANNKCTACGIPGAPCCAGDTCSGGCCYANTCVAENGACGSNAGTCQAGRCSGCGNASQPCCSKDTCYNGLLCKSGTCNPCGGSGQDCCPASSTAGQCKAGLACVGNGAAAVCAVCGGAGDYCCTGSTPCNSGCCSLTTHRCVADTSSCGSLDGGAGSDGPMSQCATGGSPCSALAHFTGTQVLDGKDDEFCSIPSFELTFQNAAKVNEYNGSGGSYHERAVARVAWDAAGIHAFIRVFDTTFTPAQAADSLWNGDGVELMFSSSKDVTGLTSSDANTLHVMISPPTAASVKDYASSGTPTPLPATSFVSGSDTTGYWVELNLPWPGTAPAASAQIKFDMQLNAADGVSKNGDSQIRDAQAVYYQAAAPASSPCGNTVYPFCDDRVWCTTLLQP